MCGTVSSLKKIYIFSYCQIIVVFVSSNSGPDFQSYGVVKFPCFFKFRPIPPSSPLPRRCYVRLRVIWCIFYIFKRNRINSKLTRAKQAKVRCSQAPTGKTQHDVTRLARFCRGGRTLMFNISVIFKYRKKNKKQFIFSPATYFLYMIITKKNDGITYWRH